MNNRRTRPGSGSSRSSGHARAGGPRRPGRGGGHDNVLPVITGVLGSSILAFSLYAFIQKHDQKATLHNDDLSPLEPDPVSIVNPVPIADQTDTRPRIKIEKKRWLTQLEEQMLKEQQIRGKIVEEKNKEKVKELTEQLRRENERKKQLQREQYASRNRSYSSDTACPGDCS